MMLRACVANRQKVCEEHLQMPVCDGKQLLTAMLYGGGAPQKLVDNDFVQRIQKASVWYRWMAASLLTPEFEELYKDGTKKNPEASVLSMLYFAAEDYILSSWSQFLLRRHDPRHMSLHFDGLRISKREGCTGDMLCKQSEDHIKDITKFDIKIKDKQHANVISLMKRLSMEVAEAKYATDHILCAHGNCIPHALGCLNALPERALELLQAKASPENVPWCQIGI